MYTVQTYITTALGIQYPRRINTLYYVLPFKYMEFNLYLFQQIIDSAYCIGQNVFLYNLMVFEIIQCSLSKLNNLWSNQKILGVIKGF